MADQRVIAAIGRMERALDRIEAAAPADPRLATRHARLRHEVSAAVREIDELLAAAGEG